MHSQYNSDVRNTNVCAVPEEATAQGKVPGQESNV